MHESNWNVTEEARIAASLGLEGAVFYHTKLSEIDGSSYLEFTTKALDVVDAHTDAKVLVVDLEKTSFVSAAGLAAFFSLQISLENSSKKLVLLDPSEAVKSVLDMTSMSKQIPVRSSMQSAS